MAEIYTVFNKEEDVITDINQTVSSGLWSGGVGTLQAMHTSSTQSGSSGKYYYDVYKTDPSSDSEAEIQFSMAFGHLDGSGSAGILGTSYTDRPSAAVYSQFRNLLLAPNDTKFTFAPSKDIKHIYAVSMARARMREKVDPGNWELHLSSSAGTVKLIDDSGATTDPTVSQGGRVYNVVSGSIASGTAVTDTAAASETTDGAYGLFYPDMGIMILNGQKLDQGYLALASNTASNVAHNNTGKLYNTVSASSYFVARREEQLSTTHYFCRLTNKKYNFSTNPTFFTQSDGSLTVSSMQNDPKVYMTTVGMYNDSNELLAVAKLSKPLLKSFSREAIVKVKLDF
jgi:hypothetical protein